MTTFEIQVEFGKIFRQKCNLSREEFIALRDYYEGAAEADPKDLPRELTQLTGIDIFLMHAGLIDEDQCEQLLALNGKMGGGGNG